jgi:hypothetical protein
MHWIDPDCLPETTGTVDLFLLNPEGEVDGFILTDGTEIHFPLHMAVEVLDGIRPGSPVKVRGLRPRGVSDMVAAIALETETGRRIVDAGPSNKAARKEVRKHTAARRVSSEIEGVVRRALHGPKGEIRGLLLEDGRAGRFPSHAAAALLPLLGAGTRILLRGDALSTEHGTVLAVRAIGASRDDLKDLSEKPHKEKHGHHDDEPTGEQVDAA